MSARAQADIGCSLATDDPRISATDPCAGHEVAAAMGADPRSAYEAAMAGAHGGDTVRQHLADLAGAASWPVPRPTIR